ncbi:hypothetical protein SCA6_000715 [Theobroma cacao]|uniref:Uncharacterized protein n=1 Tax=Theobroma cacao TaxID=3641 RepID=A0A061FQT4_THECC|nr:Uncharacterized protein TCM_043653 [Theobroma cacao]
MELLMLLAKVTGTVLLLGFSSMFVRLFDALVLTPKRIHSQLGMQEIRDNLPSFLPGNFQVPKKTQHKRKQVQHICFHQGKYRFCRGTIRIWPNIGSTPEDDSGPYVR